MVRLGMVYDAIVCNYNISEISAYMNRAKVKMSNSYLYIRDKDIREYEAGRFHVFESTVDHDITKIEPNEDKGDKIWGHSMESNEILDMFRVRCGYGRRRQ